MSAQTRSYASRAEKANPILKQLFTLMEEKKTNLCVSVDYTDPEKILDIIDKVGPRICMVKTHIDIISFPSVDAIRTFTSRLTDLSKKHNFLIFEDRKFADIGSTVQHQYRGGVYNIASWAHITNAHSFPGPGIVTGLGEVMLKEVKEPRGLLLLAEMSSAGNLSTEGEYRQKTLRMAREHKDVVCGFIAMGNQIITESGDDSDDFIFMTPGVNLADKGDAHGQQYQSPEFVIGEKKSDIIIVGRGIIKAEDPVAVAEKYRAAGWEAYEKRTAA